MDYHGVCNRCTGHRSNNAIKDCAIESTTVDTLDQTFTDQSRCDHIRAWCDGQRTYDMDVG